MNVRWIVILTFLWMPNVASGETLRVAVTTSFENSGLAEKLREPIEKDLGIKLHLVVVATGQALRLGENGDVDAILVHAPVQEKEFLKNGFATHRRQIMINDFIIIGDKQNENKFDGVVSVKDAMKKIVEHKLSFVSRGDDSGTHKKELELWKHANVKPEDEIIGRWGQVWGRHSILSAQLEDTH